MESSEWFTIYYKMLYSFGASSSASGSQLAVRKRGMIEGYFFFLNFSRHPQLTLVTRSADMERKMEKGVGKVFSEFVSQLALCFLGLADAFSCFCPSTKHHGGLLWALQGFPAGALSCTPLSKGISIANGHLSSHFWRPFTPLGGPTKQDTGQAYAALLLLLSPHPAYRKHSLTNSGRAGQPQHSSTLLGLPPNQLAGLSLVDRFPGQEVDPVIMLPNCNGVGCGISNPPGKPLFRSLG